LNTHVSAANPHTGSAASGSNTDITSITASGGLTLNGGSSPSLVFDGSNNVRPSSAAGLNLGSASFAFNGINATTFQAPGSLGTVRTETAGNNTGGLSLLTSASFGITIQGTAGPTASQVIPVGSVFIGKSAGRYVNGYFTDLTSTNALTVDSDKRVKKNVRDFISGDAISQLKKLRPVKFERKDVAGERAGFIAQEVELNLPEIVVKGDTDDTLALGDENFKPWGVKYGDLIPLLVSAVKELNDRIDNL